MADDEPQCQVVYSDVLDGEQAEFNWVKRAGKAKVTYVDQSTFEGTFDGERIKQGDGTYVWMAPGDGDDDAVVERARYEGLYDNGSRNGLGKMTYPNGDIYHGEWVDGKMHGEGSYTYKKTGDVYSGTWVQNKKQGKGDYSFGKDKSMLRGEWENGELVDGSWELKNFANYYGKFKMGRPLGVGKFEFKNGYTQDGEFVEIKNPDDEGSDEVKAPNVAWKGNPMTLTAKK